MLLGPTSPTPEPTRNPSMWGGAGSYGLGLAREDKPSPEPIPSYVVGQGDFAVPIEPSESQDHSQSLLRASTNCRTYHRPNKGKQAGDSDSTSSTSTSTSTSFSSGPGSGPLKTNNTENSNKPAGRGRTRDYTVLHPSCLSMFNVTIQDRVMEEYTPAAAVAAPLTDQGETGRLRKKIEPAPAKPTR